MLNTRRMPGSLITLVLMLGASRGSAETVNCTNIISLPATITTPGVYCLKQSLTTSISTGNAIDIQANNVVLDLNGFRLAGAAAGLATQANGIFAFNRQNITVKNGIVRGFAVGVFFQGASSAGHLVEDIRADLNTTAGIAVEGLRHIVRNNQVISTGGSTVAVGPGQFILGIFMEGAGNRVINNDVAGVSRGGAEGAGGIVIGTGINNLVVENRITSVTDYGIYFEGSGKYRDNLTSGMPTPYTGGTDAGGNN